MTRYGVPGLFPIGRTVSNNFAGPPYFYFENVANIPNNGRDDIKRHLFNIDPEFVDSRHFSACRRSRGYVHNLPTVRRCSLLPKAPMTIKELVPAAKVHWPEWDNREKLNCICTSRPTEHHHNKIHALLRAWHKKDPPNASQKLILKVARQWNLVWVGPSQLAPLTVNEIELCMGFNKDHTRSLFNTRDQFRGLGNSFQVHTVAYQFSVLKNLHPQGLRVLSLFAGIGGAEVALDKLGIRLSLVVSVEKGERERRVIENWWKHSDQSGRLITEYHDVKELDVDTLSRLLKEVGGFDLIVKGSPCSNLSGLNRKTRVGLAGDSSILFYEFPRIVMQIRESMRHSH